MRARSTPLETASIENGYMSVNHSPLCFLIAPKSEPTIHTLEAALGAAGITTELAVDTPLTAVDALIEDPRCDLVVLTHAFEHLQTCLPRLREQKPHTPIIVVAPTRSASAPTCIQTAATMSMGATDVIYADQIEQFVLVVKRELAHVCHHYRFTQMRHALKHSEERFRTLRDDHKTAVAYLQDGLDARPRDGHPQGGGHHQALAPGGRDDNTTVARIFLVVFVDGSNGCLLVWAQGQHGAASVLRASFDQEAPSFMR